MEIAQDTWGMLHQLDLLLMVQVVVQGAAHSRRSGTNRHSRNLPEKVQLPLAQARTPPLQADE